MDDELKNVLYKLKPEWKSFARAAGFSANIVDYIDFDDKSDELKLESILKTLVKKNPSNYLAYIERSLKIIGNLDVLNEVKLLRK